MIPHRGSAIHVHRLFERGIDAASRDACSCGDLPGAVGKASGYKLDALFEQQTRAFDRVAGDRDDPRFLGAACFRFIGIDEQLPCPMHRARSQSHAVRTYSRLPVARPSGFRYRASTTSRRSAALEAEADLLAGAAAVARFAVDRHPSVWTSL